MDARQRFLQPLAGVTDPERKRKIIGATFIEVFEREARRFAFNVNSRRHDWRMLEHGNDREQFFALAAMAAACSLSRVIASRSFIDFLSSVRSLW